MEITPPGDARPAFSHDIELARRTLDAQFGEGVGAAVLPDGHVTVLNKAPALDRMDEIIADGAVLGTMRYDVGRGWTFIPRMQAARAMEGVASRGRVVADDGAIPFILKGSNLLAPGVVGADPGIKPGDEIVILDRQGKAIAAGRSRMSTEEMSARGRGMAVKVRWAGEEVLPTTPGRRPGKRSSKRTARRSNGRSPRPSDSFKGWSRSMTCRPWSPSQEERTPWRRCCWSRRPALTYRYSS